MDSLEIDLITSATKEDAFEVAAEFAEIGIDAMLDSELISAIPVASTLVNITKGVATIRDRLLLKKIAHFLRGASNLNKDERESFVERLNLESPYDRQKIGEKLMLIVDAVSDNYKAEVIGRLFRAYGLGSIDDYSKLSHLCEIVERIPTENLKALEVAVIREDNMLVFHGVVEPEWPTESDIKDVVKEQTTPNRYGPPGIIIKVGPELTPAGKLLVEVMRQDKGDKES